MSEITLEALGLDQEELIDRLVNRLADNLTARLGYDRDRGEWSGEGAIAAQFGKALKKQLDEAVTAIIEKHVTPKVAEITDTLVLQATNEWGEKRGQPMTVREYFVSRADAWMKEQVDYNGNPKKADSYNWRADSTRVAYMINTRLQGEIEKAMAEAMKNAHTSIAQGLHEACRIAINQVAAKLK